MTKIDKVINLKKSSMLTRPAKTIATALINYVLTYSTEREATIQSKRVGIVYRLAQILILAYIIGWDFIYHKSYQATDVASSAVTTKVKGQGFLPVNTTKDKFLNRQDLSLSEQFGLHSDIEYMMFDTGDYVIPANEYNSIFIMSNFVRTKQTQDNCDEDVYKYKAQCQSDDDCKNLGAYTHLWNGLPTGRCINSSTIKDKTVCEITGWCPTEQENERKEDNLIRNVLNFTILLKNDIEFKRFNKKMRNIISNLTNSYISSCSYDEENDPFCPVLKVDYVLSKAEPDERDKYQMLLKGGVVLIDIIWDCDLDWSDVCFPTYQFRRFDTKETNTASGFNFRFANKYFENDKEYRVLYKAYGLRFIINVSGTAGKFNIVPCMLSIGAGLGLMSLSVIAADCVMLNCTSNKRFYQEMKELDANRAFNENYDVIRL